MRLARKGFFVQNSQDQIKDNRIVLNAVALSLRILISYIEEFLVILRS